MVVLHFGLFYLTDYKGVVVIVSILLSLVLIASIVLICKSLWVKRLNDLNVNY